MRLLNKLVVGASSVAFAAALVAGVNAPSASAANPANLADKIKVDLANQTLKVDSASDDKKVYISFPKVKDKKVSGMDKVLAYDLSNNAVDIDLSTLNVTKDNYIKVWGNKSTTPIIIKIPKAETLGKATISVKEADNTVEATISKKGETSAYTAENIEYAVGTGSWTDGGKTGKIDITKYISLGSTLRVRIAGNAAQSTASLSKSGDYEVNKSDDKIAAYELAKSFPSKEIKVKAPKQAAAPKIKVDYTKGIITFPKNAQYRKNTASALGSTWSDATSLTTKSGSDFDITAGGDIDVRVKATATKPASMYYPFAFDKQATLAVAKKTGTNDAATAEVKVKDASSVDFTLDYSRTAASGKTATSGAIKITNANADYAYEYLVIKDNTTTPAVDAKGAKSVKKGKDVTVKLKNDTDITIWVRRAAVSKGDVAWATQWTKAISLSKTHLAPTVVTTSD